MNMALDSEIRLRLLKLLEDQPEMTQRQMNKKMGVSLGKVNYCLTALIEKGMIRV
ncbi:MAG: winged helix-turn-helix transcriptional regulator, partial [Proteobacteria bacterium]|nr:winged helix-turn-helix transcriptional regulator [Pseudomonadota bacterium]